MTGFEERKKFWDIFYSPVVFFVLLVLFLLLSRAMWKVYNHQSASLEDRNRVERELSESQKRLDDLKGQVGFLETSQGVDDEIRTKFNVSKIGENVAVLVNDINATGATTTIIKDKSWWKKLLGF